MAGGGSVTIYLRRILHTSFSLNVDFSFWSSSHPHIGSWDSVYLLCMDRSLLRLRNFTIYHHKFPPTVEWYDRKVSPLLEEFSPCSFSLLRLVSPSAISFTWPQIDSQGRLRPLRLRSRIRCSTYSPWGILGKPRIASISVLKENRASCSWFRRASASPRSRFASNSAACCSQKL